MELFSNFNTRSIINIHTAILLKYGLNYYGFIFTAKTNKMATFVI